MPAFVDASVGAPVQPLSARPTLDAECAGAVLFGPEAAARRAELARWAPGRLWLNAIGQDPSPYPLPQGAREDNGTLRPVTPSATAYSPAGALPARSATQPPPAVLDLDAEVCATWLAEPAQAATACAALRGTGRLIRLKLPAPAAVLVRAKRLARRFPEARFLLDPFVHGPTEGWQGHVRLAEEPNVWLTTLGLDPLAPGAWSKEAAAEALYFVTGEVGAAKLLHASGSPWAVWARDGCREFREWLAATPALDGKEVALILSGNALRLFSALGVRPNPFHGLTRGLGH